MTQTHTFMRREIEQIPQATRDFLSNGMAPVIAAAAQLRRAQPRFMVTTARGSSDHAATYLKYAFELSMGLPVASVGPSVASIFAAPLKLDGAAFLGISQSGQSPDIVSMAKSARDHGAVCVAITNDVSAPLAQQCQHSIDICAGAEISVAATKTFVCSVVSGLALLAHWQEDTVLLEALNRLPAQMEKAAQIHWPQLLESMRKRQSLLVLGRGPGLAIANEAALKFKETCQIHAESYSSAEVLHGPVAVLSEGDVVLALSARDAAQGAINAVAEQLSVRGASVFVTSDVVRRPEQLGFVSTGHALTDPLLLIVSFYAFIERLALARGLNPDEPRNLKKVTETV